MRQVSRARHEVSAITLVLLRPVFRYSQPRRAYVFRLLGDRHGPVLVRRRKRRQT
jgi:hypothetical protein